MRTHTETAPDALTKSDHVLLKTTVHREDIKLRRARRHTKVTHLDRDISLADI